MDTVVEMPNEFALGIYYVSFCVYFLLLIFGRFRDTQNGFTDTSRLKKSPSSTSNKFQTLRYSPTDTSPTNSISTRVP
jgi:hypothetical protein